VSSTVNDGYGIFGLQVSFASLDQPMTVGNVRSINETNATVPECNGFEPFTPFTQHHDVVCQCPELVIADDEELSDHIEIGDNCQDGDAFDGVKRPQNVAYLKITLKDIHRMRPQREWTCGTVLDDAACIATQWIDKFPVEGKSLAGFVGSTANDEYKIEILGLALKAFETPNRTSSTTTPTTTEPIVPDDDDITSSAPTMPPVEPTTPAPTLPPVEPTTQAPTMPPVEPTTQAPTMPPVEPTTQAPTLPPVDPTTQPTTSPMPIDPKRCYTCLTTCAPCQACRGGPQGSFIFGSCEKCWQCWDIDDDKKKHEDKECHALSKHHEWDDDEVQCLSNYQQDCRACWTGPTSDLSTVV